MNYTSMMLESHPVDLGGMDRNALRDCIDACLACAQACTACADACLSEQTVTELSSCIRSDMNCAEICTTTANVLTRSISGDTNISRAMLQVCSEACLSCAKECEGHADMHEHCRVCADACRSCDDACNKLLASMG
jgi:hypothetical protein